MSLSAHDTAFIQGGRELEVEAVSGQFSPAALIAPADVQRGDCGGALAPDGYVPYMEERVAVLQEYVPHAAKAFKQRRLTYPFQISDNQDFLEVLPGQEELARTCAELSECVGIGQKTAKQFELRAFRSLHRLIAGWAVCVGSPRACRKGSRRAVTAFRNLLAPDYERGTYQNPNPPNSGDHGADAIWILGREWGGPVVLLQVKNSLFDPDRFAGDLVRQSDALQEWFGRRVDQCRAVITVCAVNSVLTIELKEAAFQACKAGCGYHLLDSVDILLAETRRDDLSRARDWCLEL
jgi:hypothetical protein